MSQKYDGNAIFAPFNAGLYGIDADDSDRSMLYQESKDSILAAFRAEFEPAITSALAEAGIRFVNLAYWSPREYNFANDSIDLEIEIEDETKLRAALEAHKPAILEAMASNKSYDGYFATTADKWEDVLNHRGLDILAVKVLLSGIEFPEFEWLYEHLEYEYACEKCELFHDQREDYPEDWQSKIDACIADSKKAL